jgi:hypothetical protein
VRKEVKMKWGGYPVKKVLSGRWVYYLLLVLGAAILSGAGEKWC